jgi:hypothetical protein
MWKSDHVQAWLLILEEPFRNRHDGPEGCVSVYRALNEDRNVVEGSHPFNNTQNFTEAIYVPLPPSLLEAGVAKLPVNVNQTNGVKSLREDCRVEME